MIITKEWLASISDEQGLTRGQENLLRIHCGLAPHEGKRLDPFVANFLKHCKGYRGIPQELQNMIRKGP